VTVKVLSILGFLISSTAMATIQDAVAVIPSRLRCEERVEIERALVAGLNPSSPDGGIKVEHVLTLMGAMSRMTQDEQVTLLGALKRPAAMAEERKGEGKEWKGEVKERKEVRPSSSSSSSSSSRAPVPAPAIGPVASVLDPARKRVEFDQRFRGDMGKALEVLPTVRVVDQAFVENLFLKGQVVICDLGNAQGEGFSGHYNTLRRVWDDLLTTFRDYPSLCGAFPSWESAFRNELAVALPEEKARPLPSPWRVRRLDPRTASPDAIGYTVVWSPTNEQIIIGRITEDLFFEEAFWWLKDSAGRKLTRERAQEFLGRCIHSQNSKYGTWVSYRPIPPAWTSEAAAPGGPMIEPTHIPET
jgi:hypothetical protein